MNYNQFKTIVKRFLHIEPKFFEPIDDKDDRDEDEYFNDLYRNYKEKKDIYPNIKDFVTYWFEDYRPENHSIYLKKWKKHH